MYIIITIVNKAIIHFGLQKAGFGRGKTAE